MIKSDDGSGFFSSQGERKPECPPLKDFKVKLRHFPWKVAPAILTGYSDDLHHSPLRESISRVTVTLHDAKSHVLPRYHSQRETQLFADSLTVIRVVISRVSHPVRPHESGITKLYPLILKHWALGFRHVAIMTVIPLNFDLRFVESIESLSHCIL
jgi:hypothetical protein